MNKGTRNKEKGKKEKKKSWAQTLQNKMPEQEDINGT